MESITDLIDQIIQDLINPERKLKDIFLKVKFLAFKLENQKLQDWAGKEINGYISGDQIQVIESQLDKPSPIKSVVNSALKVLYELMIEAAGSAYSPIILEQLRRLFG